MSGKHITALGLIAAAALLLSFGLGRRQSAPAVASPVIQASSSPEERTAPASHPTGAMPATTTGIRPAAPKAPPAAPSSIVETTKQTVTLQLADPDGTSTFQVGLNAGADACAVLVEAKSEGKIRSLTLDDSYLSAFHSRYVREINGYSNNWTFSVGGTEPEGCSLYKPKSGDEIIWRFGN